MKATTSSVLRPSRSLSVMSGAAVASADTPAGGVAPEIHMLRSAVHSRQTGSPPATSCADGRRTTTLTWSRPISGSACRTPHAAEPRSTTSSTRPRSTTRASESHRRSTRSTCTDLVTVTIGGNDVSYVSTLFRRSCAANRSPFDALAAPPALRAAIEGALCFGTVDRTAIQTALDGLTDELTNMVDAIRVRAPHARIVFVDYLTVLPQSGKSCVGVPLAKDDQKYILDIARQLQLTLTKHATQRTGTELVELSKASRSHDACSDDPWVKGWDVSGTVAGNAGPYHPNAKGVLAAARLLTEQLSSGRPSD